MGWILTLGLAVVLFLQSLGDWLIGPMQLLSQFGYEPFFLVATPALYWCVDAGLGLRVGFALTVSASLNHTLKLAFRGPRPYWYDARVRPLSVETSLGAPSAHAQNTMAVWGMAAAWVNTRASWVVVLALTFLVGLSRIYLGMHFPHDVLLGWLIGALILFGLLQGETLLKPWLQRSGVGAITIAALAASLVLILFSLAFSQAAQGWTLPDAWLALAYRVNTPGEIDIHSLEGVVSTAAVFFGLAVGAALLRARGWYNAQGQSRQLLARYLLGLLGLLAIYIGLDQLFPEGADLVALAFRYLRYTLIGLWVSFFAPELFIRIRLANRAEDHL